MTHENCTGRIFPHAIDEWAICDNTLDQDWADLLVDEYPRPCGTREQRWTACRGPVLHRHPDDFAARWQFQAAWRPMELHGVLHWVVLAAASTEPCS